jgi:hypothetical protein
MMLLLKGFISRTLFRSASLLEMAIANGSLDRLLRTRPDVEYSASGLVGFVVRASLQRSRSCPRPPGC